MYKKIYYVFYSIDIIFVFFLFLSSPSLGDISSFVNRILIASSLLLFSYKLISRGVTYNLNNIFLLITLALLILSQLIKYSLNNSSIQDSTKDIFLMFSIIFMICLPQKSEKFLIIKYGYLTKIIATSGVIILYLIHVLPDSILLRSASGGIRHSLGFSSPNIIGMITFSVTLDSIYLLEQKINDTTKKYVLYLLLIVVNSIVYWISFSRTSFVLSLFAVILMLIKTKNNKILSSFLSISKVIIVPFVFLIPVIFSVFYRPGVNLITKFNDLLSNRLATNQYYMDTYGVHWFGSIVPDVVLTYTNHVFYYLNEAWVIDAAYIRILMLYGMLPYIVILCILFGKFIFNRYMSSTETIILSSILIYGMFEKYSMNIFLFSTLILFSSQNTIKQFKNSKEGLS